jgi:hypothetical protein
MGLSIGTMIAGWDEKVNFALNCIYPVCFKLFDIFIGESSFDVGSWLVLC